MSKPKELLGVKPKKITVSDALLIAGSKAVAENLMSRFFGLNSSYLSSAVKLGAGITINQFSKGKFQTAGTIASTALILDGAEDAIVATKPYLPNWGGSSDNEGDTI